MSKSIMHLRIIIFISAVHKYITVIYKVYIKLQIKIALRNASEKYALYIYFLFWFQVIQVVYLSLSLTEDYLLTSSKSGKTKKWFGTLNTLNSVVFFAIIFPMTAMTTMLFWFFYYFNSDLIVPMRLLTLLPTPGHVSIHLVIVLPLLTELVFANRQAVTCKTATSVFNITLFLYALT